MRAALRRKGHAINAFGMGRVAILVVKNDPQSSPQRTVLRERLCTLHLGARFWARWNLPGFRVRSSQTFGGESYPSGKGKDQSSDWNRTWKQRAQKASAGWVEDQEPSGDGNSIPGWRRGIFHLILKTLNSLRNYILSRLNFSYEQTRWNSRYNLWNTGVSTLGSYVRWMCSFSRRDYLCGFPIEWLSSYSLVPKTIRHR